ncbi:MAG TPA: hypothetical protein VFM93_02950 [Candidatus Limnocylindria bacterium]|nr:hypothetical protein [Candidatus Limnocylindria bacterium]
MTRNGGAGPLVLVAVAGVLAAGAYLFLFGAPFADPATSAPRGGAPSASASPRATPAPKPPELKIAHDTCCTQAARFLSVTWTSSEPVSEAAVAVAPDPGFACAATVDESRVKGTFGCAGLLRGGVDHTATLTVRTAAGSFPVAHRFRTMGDRLTDVRWFTEFEDPRGDPLACAAASVRIVQNYTTGQDKATAEQILRQGQGLNRSRDPGIDPVAIAAVQRALDPRNAYHYYRFDTREDATYAAVYWLLRSGKPVHVITLAGQHDPLLIGFMGTFGTHFGDPANDVTGVVVQDPQRGDMRPETLSRRPDKYRTPEFQTGRLLLPGEWYRDEWWLGFAYAAVVDGVNIDRNDGAYPLPHWAGKFVIVVDDADPQWPADREGRVRFR